MRIIIIIIELGEVKREKIRSGKEEKIASIYLMEQSFSLAPECQLCADNSNDDGHPQGDVIY